jgi:glycosyltransferase involved in cell wall biosynthesis
MRHVIDLHGGLLRRGWDAKLIVSPKRLDDRYLDEIHALGRDRVEFVAMERAPHLSDMNAYRRIREVLRNMRGRRILHAHSTKAGLLGTLLYAEVSAMAYTPHAYRASDPSLTLLKQRALRGVEMTYSRPYDRILAVSSSEREYALACGIEEERVSCIPNGIHYAGRHMGQAARTARIHASQPITLGFIGRLVHQKNPLLFVETLAHLVERGFNMRAVVVGDGELRHEMKALAERLQVGSRIDWRGEVPGRDAIGEMDIMLHTSLYEALPYTLLEAAAAQLPIVATANHGSRSVMQGELAENIVPEATARALGDRVALLLQDGTLWSRQFDCLDQTAHEFSLETMVTKVEQVYLDLLSPGVQAPSLQRYMAPAVSRIPALI